MRLSILLRSLNPLRFFQRKRRGEAGRYRRRLFDSPWGVVALGGLLGAGLAGCQQHRQHVCGSSTPAVPVHIEHQPVYDTAEPLPLAPRTPILIEPDVAPPPPTHAPGRPDESRSAVDPSSRVIVDAVALHVGQSVFAGIGVMNWRPGDVADGLRSAARLPIPGGFADGSRLVTEEGVTNPPFDPMPPELVLAEGLAGAAELALVSESLLPLGSLAARPVAPPRPDDAPVLRTPDTSIGPGARMTDEYDESASVFASAVHRPTAAIFPLDEMTAPVESTLPAVDDVKAVELTSLPAEGRGIAIAKDGAVLVSHGRVVSRWTPMSGRTLFLRFNSPAGLWSGPEGQVYICDTGLRAVFRTTADGEVVDRSLSREDMTGVRHPAGVAPDGRGGLLLCDPGFERIKNPIGRVIHRPKSGEARVVLSRLDRPSGIAVTRDGSRLYVVEAGQSRVLAYPLSEDGQPQKGDAFADLEADGNSVEAAGITVDAEGRVYVANRSRPEVLVYSAEGTLVRRYRTGSILPVALTLRGTDSLLVAGVSRDGERGSVVELKLTVE